MQGPALLGLGLPSFPQDLLVTFERTRAAPAVPLAPRGQRPIQPRGSHLVPRGDAQKAASVLHVPIFHPGKKRHSCQTAVLPETGPGGRLSAAWLNIWERKEPQKQEVSSLCAMGLGPLFAAGRVGSAGAGGWRSPWELPGRVWPVLPDSGRPRPSVPQTGCRPRPRQPLSLTGPGSCSASSPPALGSILRPDITASLAARAPPARSETLKPLLLPVPSQADDTESPGHAAKLRGARGGLGAPGMEAQGHILHAQRGLARQSPAT